MGLAGGVILRYVFVDGRLLGGRLLEIVLDVGERKEAL